ncbi:MAG: chemotaxis response regulator protein-glutamate methylesterase [Sporolactobacillus sp.]
MKPIQVMVVDDSAFMRQTIKGMIEEDDRIQVVATARNGRDALKKLSLYRPDVITLDIVMSGDMDGLQVLRRIMEIQPTPTIMVSGASDENANYVIEAISNGAFDFIFKPTGKMSEIDRIQKELQTKLLQAVLSRKTVRPAPESWAGTPQPAGSPLSDQTDISSIGRGSEQAEKVQHQPPQARPAFSAESNPLVFIGTSTGGPKALQIVIPAFKKDLSAPVLVVQHMPPQFTRSLAERLDQMSELTVSEAREGDILENGHAYIAPGGRHLQLEEKGRQLIVHLLNTPPLHGVKPSADVTLESFLKIRNHAMILALLTGMGRDGADGLAALKERGGDVYTLAESEATCVVFGMPKAAIETGKVDRVADLQDISAVISNQIFQ